MSDPSVFLNCSMPAISYGLYEDLVNSSFNMTRIESAVVTKFAGFGAVSGVLMALLINFLFHFEYEVFKKKVKLKDKMEYKKMILLITLPLILPFVLLFLLVAIIYKILCSIIIKRKDKHFVGFLRSFDVFWCLEDDTSKSIVNVLGVIECTSSQELVEHIREKLQSIVQNSDAEKLFYRRNELYGFYYWKKCCYIDISQYVRIIDVSKSTELNESDLEEIMTEISYQPLPFNDEGLFQVLITNQKLKNNNGKDEYGIIIRLHHAIGDGVALIEFLCETIADDRQTDSRDFCVPVIYNQSSKRTLANCLKIIIKFCKIPSCLVDSLLREPDRTSIHGPALNGKKIFKWMEYDQDLLRLVKAIKKSTKLNFSDILISSLSRGLRDYFLQEIDPAPNTVAVILPVRFPQNKTDSVRLENNFTVSILDLEVGADIETVKRRMNELRNSADPLSNHLFLKLCSILPKEILRPAFYSNQATMAFSNLPGPKALTICGGLLKSLVFFVPNNGNTGLGITALGYGGVLRFGAMADSALISSTDELAIILNGMVKGIKQLHKEFVKYGEDQMK